MPNVLIQGPHSSYRVNVEPVHGFEGMWYGRIASLGIEAYGDSIHIVVAKLQSRLAHRSAA